MKKLLLVFLVAGFVTPLLLGLRGSKSTNRPLMLFFDMDFQPKYRSQGESEFFADGSAQRQPPAGVIPFGGNDYFSDAGSVSRDEDFLAGDDAFYRGKDGETWIEKTLGDVTITRLKEGQKYYNRLCSVCHGATGQGNGIVKEYGFSEIPSLVDQRVSGLPDGQIYHTIANGKGLMQGYGHQLDVEPRWSVVLYVRALQKSRNATMDDVPLQHKKELENQ